MAAEHRVETVGDLQKQGVLLVEDGNHGEYRPLPGEFVGVGTPFVRPDDLKDGRVDFPNCDRINDQALSRVRKGKGRSGDILFTHRATVGRIARAGYDAPHFVANPGVTIWRSTSPDILDPVYLYFFMQTSNFMDQVWAEAGNTDTFPYVSLTQQRGLNISFPCIERQRAIAHILGALDDKIELNRRMNKTLEAMARTLFKSWFVDFDPVRAKAEGRDPSLPEPIADLFPSGFADSALVDIPERWRVSDLRSVTAYLNRGISPAYIENGGVLVLNQKCVREGRVDPSKGRRHNPEARSVDGRLLKKGDILVNSTGVGTLGRVAQVLSLPGETIVDSHVTVVRADEGTVSWNYLGIWLRDREQEIEALGEGSTGQTELSRSRLGELSILVPPPQMMLAFDEASLPIRERSTASEKESQLLVAIRDALLPKLISGELRLKDAEQVVAEAAQ